MKKIFKTEQDAPTGVRGPTYSRPRVGHCVNVWLCLLPSRWSVCIRFNERALVSSTRIQNSEQSEANHSVDSSNRTKCKKQIC